MARTLSPDDWALLERLSEGTMVRRYPDSFGAHFVKALLDWYHCDRPHPLAVERTNA